MRSIFFIFSVVFSSLFTPSAFAEPLVINVGVSQHQQIKNQLSFLMKDTPCDSLPDYKIDKPSRVFIESILICQALVIGGIEPTFNFVAINNIPRLLRQVSNGDIDLMIDSVWLDLADKEKVFISDPLLKEGDFFKGIYIDEKNTELLKIRTVTELQKFNAVSSDFWQGEWQALQEMGITAHSVSKYRSMLKMVHANRADFLLDDFTDKEDLSQVYKNIRLVPIPNIKVALHGSRHILVNRKNSNGLEIYTALQTGLKELRKQGRIKQAYQQGGFINKRVADWEVICCEKGGSALN